MTRIGRLSVATLVLLASALPATPRALAQRVALVGAPPVAFKFSEVTSRETANNLVALGSLVKIYLFPTELGGEDAVENIAYVTPEAAERRAAIAGEIRRRFRRHLIDQIEVLPDYAGDSIVPRRIRFKTWHSRGGKRFEEQVEIW